MRLSGLDELGLTLSFRACCIVASTLTLGCSGGEPGDTTGTGGGDSSSAPTAGADTTMTPTSGAPSSSGGPGGDTTGATTDEATGGSTSGSTSGPAPDTTAGETGETDTGVVPPEGWEPRDSARIFISGHSLTDNPLADFVLAIAEGLGKDFGFNQQIGIGSPIRVRTLGGSWDNLDWPGYRTGKNRDGFDMDVIAELKDPQTLGVGEKYDTLVITERHDILGTIQWEDTAGLLRHFHDRFIDGNPAGQTLFYHSWLDIDKAAPQQWIDHEKHALYAWECIASKINLSLADEGRAERIATLPVGAALVDLVERVRADEVAGISGSDSEKMSAIFSDNVHLTPLGAYYAALVTYAAVFRSSPVGAVVPQDVAPGPAADLQGIAWEFVRDYYTAPNAGVHSMEECRSFISETVCPSFWTLRGEPGQVPGCSAHFLNSDPNNSGNPFKWPDPGMKVWPAP